MGPSLEWKVGSPRSQNTSVLVRDAAEIIVYEWCFKKKKKSTQMFMYAYCKENLLEPSNRPFVPMCVVVDAICITFYQMFGKDHYKPLHKNINKSI